MEPDQCGSFSAKSLNGYQSKIFQIVHRPLYKTILCHIQVGINFHRRPDTGVTDGFGEGRQIKIGIVLMLDVIMGHISMPEPMHGHIMGQANLLADFSVSLTGAAADTAAKGEVGRTADIFVFPVNSVILDFSMTLLK